MFDAGLSTLVADLDDRGLLDDTLVVAVGEFGRSPQRGLSTSRQRQQRRRPRPLAVLLHRPDGRRRHQARLRPRQERQDRQRPGRGPGAPHRAAGDGLLRPGHRAARRSSTTTSTSRASWSRAKRSRRCLRSDCHHDDTTVHDEDLSETSLFRRRVSSCRRGEISSPGTRFASGEFPAQPLFRELELLCNVPLALPLIANVRGHREPMMRCERNQQLPAARCGRTSQASGQDSVGRTIITDWPGSIHMAVRSAVRRAPFFQRLHPVAIRPEVCLQRERSRLQRICSVAAFFHAQAERAARSANLALRHASPCRLACVRRICYNAQPTAAAAMSPSQVARHDCPISLPPSDRAVRSWRRLASPASAAAAAASTTRRKPASRRSAWRPITRTSATFCDSLTAESQDVLAGALVMMGVMLQDRSRHGRAARRPEAPRSQARARAVIPAILAEARRRLTTPSTHDATRLIFRRLCRASPKMADVDRQTSGVHRRHVRRDASNSSGDDSFGEEFYEQLAGELQDVTIDGDRATAVVVTESGEEPLEFRKTPAGWKLHISADDRCPAPPPPARTSCRRRVPWRLVAAARRQSHRQVEHRDQVDRVVQQDGVHLALEPRADKLLVRRGNLAARQVVDAHAPADAPLRASAACSRAVRGATAAAPGARDRRAAAATTVTPASSEQSAAASDRPPSASRSSCR